MVTEVYIKDNKNTPIRYLADLGSFKNGTRYTFKEGVNILVGENGCGKTTLLNLIRCYLLVDEKECDKGLYNSNINRLFYNFGNKTMFDGADVYSDYDKNVFRLCHATETSADTSLKDFNSFGTFMTQANSSTGEGVMIALSALFDMMFGKGAKLKYNYSQLEKIYPLYIDYINKHRVRCADEWTILMDEPDRNLSLENVSQIKDILSYHKPNTQIIAVVHNPLIIYALANDGDVNFIEMSEGYIEKVKKEINKIIK